MIPNLAFILYLHLLFFPIGIFVSSRGLRKHSKPNILICGILGYSVVSILSQILYRFGISILQICTLVLLLSVCISFYILAFRRFYFSIKLTSYGIYIVALIFVIGPAVIGGGQFVIFQGNSYDHFNYLQSAIAYQDHHFYEINSADLEKVLRDPFVEYGSAMLLQRPAIIILYSVSSVLFRDVVVLVPYVFLGFFVSQMMLAIFTVARQLDDTAPKYCVLLLAGAFGLGFWGQYLVDQNWWSQVSATPLLILLTFEFLSLASGRRADMSRWDYVKLIVLLTGSIYLYPEAVAMLMPGAMIVMLLLWKKHGELRLKVIAVGCASLCIVLLQYDSIIVHTISQAVSATSTGISLNIHGYHGHFIFGNDGISRTLLEQFFVIPIKEGFEFGTSGSILSEAIDILSGISGVFFLTPNEGYQAWNAGFIRVTLLALIASCIGFLILSIKQRWFDLLVRNYVLFFSMGLFVIVILLFNGSYYGVLKGYFYLVPVCWPLFIFAFRYRHKVTNLIIPFLCVQLLFGATRLYAVNNTSGVHYKFPPYPSANLASEKHKHNWDISYYSKLMKVCSGIKIEANFDNGFYERFVQLLAKQNKIPYYLEGPVRENYGQIDLVKGFRAKKNRGYMDEIQHDCLVKQSVGQFRKELVIELQTKQ